MFFQVIAPIIPADPTFGVAFWRQPPAVGAAAGGLAGLSFGH